MILEAFGGFDNVVDHGFLHPAVLNRRLLHPLAPWPYTVFSNFTLMLRERPKQAQCRELVRQRCSFHSRQIGNRHCALPFAIILA